MFKPFRFSTLCISALLTSACAQLHHVQIGDISGDEGDLAPFEIMVSETGVNIQEGTQIAKSLTQNQTARDSLSSAEAIIALFQYGPRTGNLVYSDTYADHLAQEIRSKCSSGKLTGLVSIRETRKYPVISGEIVKIKGFCILPKKTGVHS
jgi:hypothetical protein